MLYLAFKKWLHISSDSYMTLLKVKLLHVITGNSYKAKGFCINVCKDCLIYLTSLRKRKKSAVQPEKRKRESSLVPIISEQEVSGSFRLELA